MPCRTDPPYDEEPRRQREKKTAEAMLCAVLSVLDKTHTNGYNAYKDIRSKIDYLEGGFTETELMTWWANHQAKDRERKAREAAEERKLQVRQQAMSKLSHEERLALGL